MDEIKLELLAQLYDSGAEALRKDRVIRCNNLIEWHRSWLGNVYPWAGHLRSVNFSKGGFHFPAAAQIPRLPGERDGRYLSKFTPCAKLNDHQSQEALAVIHVELVLIPATSASFPRWTLTPKQANIAADFCQSIPYSP